MTPSKITMFPFSSSVSRFDRSLVSVSLSVACLALSACGSFENVTQKGKVDYKTTVQTKPLDIPPDLTSVSADERFVVPDVGARGTANASAQSIPGQGAIAVSGSPVLVQPVDARIERNGNQRWIVINRPVEQVWPQVREFWLQNGFVLKTDRPEIGILETDWAENRAKIPLDGVRKIVGKVFDGLYSSEELDRYRTRLERVGNTTEVYISHRGLQEVYEDSSNTRTVWTPRPSDPELEAELLNRLLVRLAGDAASKPAEARAADLKTASTLPASGAASQARAVLVKVSETDTRLQVRETFDRSWRRVGLALDRTGFVVEDRDRSKGVYFVQYREPADRTPSRSAAKGDEQTGFFSRLFSRNKGQDAAKDIRLDGRYRIRVASVEGRTEVTVLNSEGLALAQAASERILGLLENELR